MQDRVWGSQTAPVRMGLQTQCFIEQAALKAWVSLA